MRARTAHGGEGQHIGRSERIKIIRRHLRRPIPSQQLKVKIKTHLRNSEMSRNHQGPEQIIMGVRLQHHHGGLSAGQNHRLGEVLQHKGQRGGGVGETVGAVQHDEAGEEGVVLLDDARDLVPAAGVDGGGVEQVVEFQHAVPHAAAVGAEWGPQRLDRFAVALGGGDDLEGFRVGAVVEGGPGAETLFEESAGLVWLEKKDGRRC